MAQRDISRNGVSIDFCEPESRLVLTAGEDLKETNRFAEVAMMLQLVGGAEGVILDAVLDPTSQSRSRWCWSRENYRSQA